MKRVYVPPGTPDFTAPPGLARLRAFVEIKTVWHPDRRAVAVRRLGVLSQLFSG